MAVPYTKAVLLVQQVVLLGRLRELIGRPFWVTDHGISLTKPEKPPCEVCEVVGCKGSRHADEQSEDWQRNRCP